MAKQINLIVNSCGECKTPCDLPDFMELDIIHPDCPLEDVKRCEDCLYEGDEIGLYKCKQCEDFNQFKAK